jgi:hypothetical protein
LRFIIIRGSHTYRSPYQPVVLCAQPGTATCCCENGQVLRDLFWLSAGATEGAPENSLTPSLVRLSGASAPPSSACLLCPARQEVRQAQWGSRHPMAQPNHTSGELQEDLLRPKCTFTRIGTTLVIARHPSHGYCVATSTICSKARQRRVRWICTGAMNNSLCSGGLSGASRVVSMMNKVAFRAYDSRARIQTLRTRLYHMERPSIYRARASSQRSLLPSIAR